MRHPLPDEFDGDFAPVGLFRVCKPLQIRKSPSNWFTSARSGGRAGPGAVVRCCQSGGGARREVAGAVQDDGALVEKRIDRFVRERLRPAVHRASVSLRVGAGIPEAVAEGYRLNLPLCSVTGVRVARVDPLIEVDHPAVVVEAVKLAEDRSGDLIVRLSEAHGSRVRARVIRHFAATDVTETDLLERPLAAPRAPFAADGSALTLELRPFQLVTLRFARR
ncbi:hypothetical protein E3T40_05945 [Cryobacterium sp. TMT1-19]|nr:hypothetical protein E3T40_05945 [Cryobacterium sp. TMT1-19]